MREREREREREKESKREWCFTLPQNDNTHCPKSTKYQPHCTVQFKNHNNPCNKFWMTIAEICSPKQWIDYTLKRCFCQILVELAIVYMTLTIKINQWELIPHRSDQMIGHMTPFKSKRVCENGELKMESYEKRIVKSGELKWCRPRGFTCLFFGQTCHF